MEKPCSNAAEALKRLGEIQKAKVALSKCAEAPPPFFPLQTHTHTHTHT